MLRRCLLLVVVAVIAPLRLAAVPFRDDETSAGKDERMAWWRQAKFGMFVHWGLYAAAEGQWQGRRFPDMRPGIEWLMCKGAPGGIDPETYVATLAPRMTLAAFDPATWAARAADAGVQYFVITAKHHDGFGMVDFPGTDYDVAGRTPYAADPMQPLARAMRARGIRFGFYFSQSQDWSKPGGRPDWFPGLEGEWDAYVAEHAVPQLRHLLGGSYGDIDVLWFDSGRMTRTQEGAARIWQELAAQPSLLVNNRLKFGSRGDFDTPEQWIPPVVQDQRPWETCMTMNESWGYNPADAAWKSTDTLIRNLCLVVSRGGNFLLNVGPRADGSWPPEVQQRLSGIGAWMRVNGESIYGTRANPLGHVRWGTVTWKPMRNGCRVYAHIFDWPRDGALRLPLAGTVRRAALLGDPHAHPVCKRGQDGLVVRLNRPEPVHPAATVLALDLDVSAPERLPLVVRQEPGGTVRVLAQEADCEGGVRVHRRTPQLEGWDGNRTAARRVRWRVRLEQGHRAYRLVARYGYNAAEAPTGMAFQVRIADAEFSVPIEITGVEPDPRNTERNRLSSGERTASGTVVLSAGLHLLEVRAVGAPTRFDTPPAKENRQTCYSAFALLEELRLEPVASSAAPPNVIFFIADDMRPHHFNCLPEGRGRNLTPNLDRLAREGTLLTGMHVTSPICTPSRFACLTGRYPSRARNPWFTQRTEREGQTVVEFNTHILPTDATLPRRLREAGYVTGMVGKNHVVEAHGLESFPDFDADARAPENRARLKRNHERVKEAVRKAGFDYVANVYHNNPDFLGLHEVAVQNMDWITAGGLDFIDGCGERPFFLYFATTVPHAPSSAERSWNADPLITAEGYLDRAPEVQPSRSSIPERLSAAGLPVDDDTANLLWLDDALGALLTRLETRGLLDHTVVFFLSDHGQNAKGTLYQSGVHDPAIVWRQGGFPCGGQLDALLSNVDFAPTILDLADVSQPGDGLDGESFLPYLLGQQRQRTDRVLYFELGYARAVRAGPWKYLAVRYPEHVEGMSLDERAQSLKAWNADRRRRHMPIVTTDPARPFSHLTPIPGGGHAEIESTGAFPGYYDRDQLYNLAADPREQRNLADDPRHAERLKALRGELETVITTLPGEFPL